MSKIRFFTYLIALITVCFFLAASANAQEADAIKKAETEMKAALGTVPLMLKEYPENFRAAAWEWFKATQSPDAALPGKISQLIALGVASQIPCAYCVYGHTTMAKMLGATDAEIKEAVASAAATRHWSTIINGAAIDLDDFKKEWDSILAHMKKQMASGTH